MRINVFVANATGLSRRAADKLVSGGKITINGQIAKLGDIVEPADVIKLDGKILSIVQNQTLILNKPVGYVCSRKGQGSKTIYELLPAELHKLKPVGRLDKDSSGLLVMTTDGRLAHNLTHPSFNKPKIYEVRINKPLSNNDFIKITQTGVNIGDERLSQFQLQQLGDSNQEIASSQKLIPNSFFLITISEGRNRQIRRTFSALGYKVTNLHRVQFGNYKLESLENSKFKLL